ncbi:hypothetical protein L2E82_49648 [Cichorium intybus]|uniref:Uncharacterized protein n=1 Tax=Cichorium intybus TaxID=13427 RepID=A0ACB8Z0Z3_CICIN|nr:hypothetical protein L2E82_49648 [Cichorium intybus]
MNRSAGKYFPVLTSGWSARVTVVVTMVLVWVARKMVVVEGMAVMRESGNINILTESLYASLLLPIALVVDITNPIVGSGLPLLWSDQENLIRTRNYGRRSPVSLQGSDRFAWKLELSDVVPEVYMLSKGKTWIKLQTPMNGYGNVIKTVLIVVRGLHFAKRNADATRDQISGHLASICLRRSYDVVEPIEKNLSAHLPLIRSVVDKDKDLAKSKVRSSHCNLDRL